jgi:hypothetical protein
VRFSASATIVTVMCRRVDRGRRQNGRCDGACRIGSASTRRRSHGCPRPASAAVRCESDYRMRDRDRPIGLTTLDPDRPARRVERRRSDRRAGCLPAEGAVHQDPVLTSKRWKTGFREDPSR